MEMKKRGCPNCKRTLPARQFKGTLTTCKDCLKYQLCNRYIKEFQTIRRCLAGEEINGLPLTRAVINHNRKHFEDWVTYITKRYGAKYQYKE
jgi:hypothetical protein